MRLRMLVTTKGSSDGIAISVFLEGETYSIHGQLAQTFLREGWAVDANAPPLEPTPTGETDPDGEGEQDPAPVADPDVIERPATEPAKNQRRSRRNQHTPKATY